MNQERMREILLESTPLATEYEIAQFLNRPEIKSLFEGEEVNNTPTHICESSSLGGLRGSCPSCGSTVYTQDVKSSCATCGHEIIWPTETTKESGTEKSAYNHDCKEKPSKGNSVCVKCGDLVYCLGICTKHNEGDV
jgi:predicted RNA-binding Zn-ribbon protein involved in translation (DUF1610 family)